VQGPAGQEEPRLAQPPHSAEAEQSVIGALLLANGLFEDVSWLSADAFYQDRHRRIWPCIVRMLEAGKPADVMTVCEELQRLGELDKAGGAAYIAGLSQNTPSARNLKRYAEIVEERAVQRQLFQVGSEIAEFGLRPGALDVAELVEKAETKIFAIADRHRGGGARSSGDVVHIGQALNEYVEWVDTHPNGIETGLTDLDSLTGGFMPGNLVLVAGRPSMGKTALALQFSEHICADKPGTMFSLEATRREIAGRMIEWHKHRAGRDAAVDKIFNLKLFIDDTASISPGMVRSRLRRAKRQHGLARGRRLPAADARPRATPASRRSHSSAAS
jgi:replicative DNA helicase